MKTCRVSLVCLLLGLGVAAASPNSSVHVGKDIESAIKSFTTTLYQKIIPVYPNNEVHSPLSVNFVLTKMDFGAGGTTKSELHQVLELPESQSDVAKGYTAIAEKFENVPDIEFSLSNIIYVSENINVVKEYRDAVQSVFKAAIKEVNFASPNSKVTINDWARLKTHNLIPAIIDDGDITASTRVIFLSLVYFKGDWNSPFKAVGKRRFHVGGSESVIAEAMAITSTFRNGDVKDVPAKFIMIPFKNSEFSLIVFRPNEIDGFETVKKGIEKVDFADMINAGSDNTYQVFLPKFKFETKIDAQPIVDKMGIKEAFKSTADFSGITGDLFHVTKFLHKTVIEANESGINSASGSAPQGESDAHSSVLASDFDINRSFIAKLVHITREGAAVKKVMTLIAVDVEDPTKN